MPSLREPVLAQELNTTLFRIFQETLTNIIRHAGATRVAVNLKEADGKILLQVRDNGRGISDAEQTSPGSMGLLGMRERAALLGGDFKITTPRSRGTQITVSIPVRHPRREQKQNHENPLSRRPRRRTPWVEANSG